MTKTASPNYPAWISLCCSAEMRAAVIERARAEDRTMSAWVRRLLARELALPPGDGKAPAPIRPIYDPAELPPEP